jgi:diacylglycerol kinase family enzyme
MPAPVIIHNPQSGNGAHGDTVQARVDLCVRTRTNRDEGEAIALTEQAVEAGYSTIVAGGGDGTVNEIV